MVWRHGNAVLMSTGVLITPLSVLQVVQALALPFLCQATCRATHPSPCCLLAS